MVTSVSGLSRKVRAVSVAIAVSVGFAVPAYGQTNAATGNTATTPPQPAEPLPQGQPAATQTPTTPSSPTSVTPAPATSGPSGTSPATDRPEATPSDTATAPETPPPMAKGVRRTAEGRLAFSGSQPGAVDLPRGGKRTIKSLLNVTKPLSYGEYVWDDKGIPKGRIWILVDPVRQLISVFRGKYEIGTAVTLYGADAFPTPSGHFRVLARMKDHFSRTYDNAPMPYTLRLTNDGVSIHGNNVLEGYASHGCIGVPLEFARRLFAEARIGDEVFILQVKQAKSKLK